MKVTFDDENNMIITPETWKEDEQLKTFYLKHKGEQVNRCILFNRFQQ